MTERQQNVRAVIALVLLVLGIAAANWLGSRPTDAPVGLEPEATSQRDLEPLPERTSFIAFARDFEGFRSWERHAVEGAMVPTGVEPGPTYVYRNRPAPEHARAYPVGTILVKAIETGEPDDWILHAMVKRGAPYNHDGTVGWEFFELDLAHDGATSVVWRGQSPPSGHGYGAHGRDAGIDAAILTCNDCHAASWQTDGVLTPELSLLPLPRH